MTETWKDEDLDVENKTDLEGTIVTPNHTIKSSRGRHIPAGTPCLIKSRPHGGVHLRSPPCPGCGDRVYIRKVEYDSITPIARARPPTASDSPWSNDRDKYEFSWEDIFDNQDDYPDVMEKVVEYRENAERYEVNEEDIQ